MANIIAKDNLDHKIKAFLEDLKEAAQDKYLIVQFKEEKIVVSSLNGWLTEKKE